MWVETIVHSRYIIKIIKKIQVMVYFLELSLYITGTVEKSKGFVGVGCGFSGHCQDGFVVTT